MSGSEPKKRITIKVILIGNSGVGKTSILNRLIFNKFAYQYKATIGADFHTREVELSDKIIVIQIWDTAGQERYQSLGVTFYKGSEGCFLVYDVTDLESFDALEKWRKEFLRRVGSSTDSFPFIVLGNKCDKEDRRVSKERARGWALNAGAEFFEISARDTTGVEEAFMKCVELVEIRHKSEQNNKNALANKEKPSIKLTEATQKVSKSCC
eukprot:TRINITY_DN5699_c0_g2_i7.p1 TRINITY_DN5699_c0_g2~~TRINITY_DN5699_c0_g2_i7.p1  ORF type:complete len:211 (-),score=67.72 TRINITY_DN5699_c0_g2_i7:112-744(-)